MLRKVYCCLGWAPVRRAAELGCWNIAVATDPTVQSCQGFVRLARVLSVFLALHMASVFACAACDVAAEGRCAQLCGAGCIARAWRRMRTRRLHSRRSAAAVMIQAAVRGLAARRRVAQLQRERRALRAKRLCGEQETLEPCTCQKQDAKDSNGTADAVPTGPSCSSEAATPSNSERSADPSESTAVAAGSPRCAAVPGVLGHVDSRLLPASPERKALQQVQTLSHRARHSRL